MSSPAMDKSLSRGPYMSPVNPRDRMLYIFYVDIAKCFTLDINLINENILHLKQIIERMVEIPVNKQVLLISGGDCLVDENKIGSYPAGTDTNPIFLFNRSFLDGTEPPFVVAEIRTNSALEAELQYLFESIENQSTPMSLYTVEKVHQLAKKYFDLTTEVKDACEQLNSDQLLQHQGFAAAMANLDDVLRTFEGQFAGFDNSYNKYLETRAENIDLINRFAEDITLLSKIPILPALLDGNEEERARLEICCDRTKSSDISLLQWISAKEPEQSLENMIEICKEALLKYDEHALISLKEDINSLISPEKLTALRNTAEITEKLMSLSALLVTIRDTYDNQMRIFSGIRRNHNRATEIREQHSLGSILPDLIAAHRDTLRMMKANHTNIRSCRQLCLQAKKELCDIIHKKLKAVMTMQERAAEIRSMLVLHGANMKRVRGYVEVVQQLHSTPRNYFAAVSEVVRRRSYSQAFLMWASDLACKIYTIYTEETERRKKFMAQFEGHFLNCLFPGLEDMPPNFATQAPPLFDNNLPALCEDDLKVLCQHLPDLEACTQLPDVEAIRNFFLTKSLTLSEYEEDDPSAARESQDDKLALVMSTAGHQQDVVVTMSYEDSSTAEKNAESNQIDRLKHENDMKTMRDGFAVLGTVAHNTVVSMREDLSALRNWVYSHQAEIIAVVQKLYTESQQQQCHIQNLLQKLHQKDDKIKSLYVKISDIETEKMEESSEEEKIEKRINEAVTLQTSQITKQITEELTIKHKKEIEALRQRFKLMTCTNMERSPSDSSLEKIERGDAIEYANHESIVNQLKHDMEQQLHKAIANERYACEVKLEEELRKVNTQFETEKQLLAESVRRPLIEEFEKQMKMMKARESALVSDLQRHKETIHTLTGHEGGSYSLLNRIEELEREKTRLETELIKERTARYSFSGPSTSSSLSYNTDSGCSSTSLASNSSSPEVQCRSRFKERIAYKKGSGLGSHRTPQCLKNRSAYLVQGKINIQSCNVGDPVLVVWDEVQRNYTILQESSTLYFLHPSSIDQLGLKPASDGSPRKLYCPAEVIEKEYCAPKKTTNRYNLKEGERFYRVKVRPLTKERTL